MQETKNLRRDKRLASPALSLLLDGIGYGVRNWSLGGFLLEGAPEIGAGGLLQGELRVEGAEEAVAFAALVLRRDVPKGTLACRFVRPSAALIDALDRVTATRLRAPGRRATQAAAMAATLLLAALPAWAAGPSATAAPASTLVPGGFALPEFRLNFPDMLATPPAEGDLQISLMSSDKSVLQFLFSPRSQFGMLSDPGTGTSRSYVGLSWNLFENNGFFSNFGIAGSLTRPGAEEMNRHGLGPPLALHSTVEFGYQLGSQHSLTLSLDHASAPDLFGDHGDSSNFRLRYGLKF
ncbi:MAG TPA: hypothetical protein VFA22_00830 [Stellaceae bacterium]|nr:hypothetical protein [Stellaceae bacterium]